MKTADGQKRLRVGEGLSREHTRADEKTAVGRPASEAASGDDPGPQQELANFRVIEHASHSPTVINPLCGDQLTLYAS